MKIIFKNHAFSAINNYFSGDVRYDFITDKSDKFHSYRNVSMKYIHILLTSNIRVYLNTTNPILLSLRYLRNIS